METVQFYLDRKVAKKLAKKSIIMVVISFVIILVGIFFFDLVITGIVFIAIGLVGIGFFSKAAIVYRSHLKDSCKEALVTVSDFRIIDQATMFNEKEILWQNIDDVGLIEYNKTFFIGIKVKDKKLYMMNMNLWEKFNVWYNGRVGLGDLSLQINLIDETPENIYKCMVDRFNYVNNIEV